ncbi:LacI family DNA-binding transcriptional regulator [Kitasatospora terrestris]|uniref:LacI family DNA-binding transcriptional regulator n=1 Tax=Kitasatospora terrestris TaxID=258051 RepID=A0ABP9DIF0_9ACTN
MPAMVDVARAAGVSPQTVSRVLAGHPNVRPQTRERVLAAVDRLDYRPNNAARMLSSGRTLTVGAVMMQLDSYARTAYAQSIERAALRHGYNVNVATTPSVDSGAVETALRRLVDQSVEGIVLAVPLINVSPGIEQLTRAIPCVAVDGSRTSSTEVLAIDQAAIGRVATEHLLGLGHRTVWRLSGPSGWLECVRRAEGWRSALQDAGCHVPPELEGDWSPESGYRNGLILGRIPEATAIMVDSDEMAFGTIRALHELGRRVPEDVSVVSVDDIPLARYCTPPLTTVAQPFAEIGALAVDCLMRQLTAESGTAPRTTPIEPQLVLRASTGQSAEG